MKFVVIATILIHLLLWYITPVYLSYADSPSRAGLVVQFGDGHVETRCVEFAEPEITGLELPLRSGLEIIYEGRGIGAAVCKIGHEGCNFPKQACFCQCPGGPGCTFWSYWHLKNGTWQFSMTGASAYRVRNGDVEGWKWGSGAASGAETPPIYTFEQLCPSFTATPVPSAAAGPQNPTAAPPPTSLPPPIATAAPTDTTIPQDIDTPAPEIALAEAANVSPSATAPPAPSDTPIVPEVTPADTIAPTETPTVPPTSTITPVAIAIVATAPPTRLMVQAVVAPTPLPAASPPSNRLTFLSDSAGLMILGWGAFGVALIGIGYYYYRWRQQQSYHYASREDEHGYR